MQLLEQSVTWQPVMACTSRPGFWN